MALELELDRDSPSLSRDERAIQLQLEREQRELERGLELDNGSIKLERGHEKIDQLADNALNCLPKDEQKFINDEVSGAAYLKTGDPANIQKIEYDHEHNLVKFTVGHTHSLTLDMDERGFEKPLEVRERLGEIQTLEQEHKQLVKDADNLESMTQMAIAGREKEITLREIDIDNASRGLGGLWNKLAGQIPEPYPTLEEQPLTKEDLISTLRIAEVRTESFSALFNDRYAGIQEDPRNSIDHLNELVAERQERLDQLSLEVTNDLKLAELERHPELEAQPTNELKQEGLEPLDRIVERTQEERDAMPLAPELNLTQANEINTRNDDRLEEINQELQVANDARQIEIDGDSIEVADADRTLSNQLIEDMNSSIDERREVTDIELEQLEVDLETLDKDALNLPPVSEEVDFFDRALDTATNLYDSAVDSLSHGIENTVEIAKTTAALGETVAIETVNFASKMGANVAGTAAFGYEWVRTGDFNQGADAMQAVREGMIDEMRIKTSQFSQEQLSESAIAEIGQWIQEKGADAYDLIEEKYGLETAEIAKGLGEAGLDIAGVLGVGALAKGAQNLVRGTRTIEPLTHMTLHAEDILRTGKLGQPGDIFAGPLKNADLNGWRLASTTGLSATAPYQAITVTSEAFSKVTPIGIYTGWQRAMGHQYTPRGILDIYTGDFTRTGINWSQVKNYGADVVIDSLGIATWSATKAGEK